MELDGPARQGLPQPVAGQEPLQPAGVGPGPVFVDLLPADVIIITLSGF
jgi:hypothetical protein